MENLISLDITQLLRIIIQQSTKIVIYKDTKYTTELKLRHRECKT